MRSGWGIAVVFLAGSAAMPAGEAAAAPVPSTAPVSWELSFEFHDPERVTLVLPGDTDLTTFWYVLYRVTNDSGQDVQFYPSFTLATDDLEIVEGGADISPSVYDAIRARHKREYPFFDEPRRISGLLLQGEDNARTSAAVFRMFGPAADGFAVFAAGLSGEVARVRNPGFDPDQGDSENNPRFFTLRKTLAIDYTLPGDSVTRSLAKPVRVRRYWVMR